MFNKLKSLRKVAGFAFAGLSLAFILNNFRKEFRVDTPYALADINADGIEDVVVTVPQTNQRNFDNLGYHDGRHLRKTVNGNLYRDSEGFLYVRGGAMPLMGTPVKTPQRHTQSRIIQVGNFDSNPMLDVKVIDTTPDFPVSYDQVLYNVFSVPKKN